MWCWQVLTGFVETSSLAHGSFHRAACHTGQASFRLSKPRESEGVAQMEATVFLRPSTTACVCASLCPEHSFSHSCDLLPLIFQVSSSVTPSESFCKVVYPVMLYLSTLFASLITGLTIFNYFVYNNIVRTIIKSCNIGYGTMSLLPTALPQPHSTVLDT